MENETYRRDVCETIFWVLTAPLFHGKLGLDVIWPFFLREFDSRTIGPTYLYTGT